MTVTPTEIADTVGARPLGLMNLEGRKAGKTGTSSHSSFIPHHFSSPLTLELDAAALPKESRVKTSRIRTLSVSRPGGNIGKARPEEVELAVTEPDQIAAQ
jgi:hypothetical protein